MLCDHIPVIQVTISLVALNQRHDLERLLPSLMPVIQFARAEVLLVDNRSTDGTVQWVKSNYPEVDVVFNDTKAGYGENHNVNLQRARGTYFIIMNSDMIVSDDIVSKLMNYLDTHPDVGIVTPKILTPDGSVQFLNKRLPSLLDLFLRRFASVSIQRIFERRMAYYEMRDIGYDREHDVPNMSGCFMFCRTSLLRDLEGFDMRYFLYFEDTDLCRRIQKTHRTVYYPDATVLHYWERAAHKNWKFSWIFMRSAWRYFNCWGWKLF